MSGSEYTVPTGVIDNSTTRFTDISEDVERYYAPCASSGMLRWQSFSSLRPSIRDRCHALCVANTIVSERMSQVSRTRTFKVLSPLLHRHSTTPGRCAGARTPRSSETKVPGYYGMFRNRPEGPSSVFGSISTRRIDMKEQINLKDYCH